MSLVKDLFDFFRALKTVSGTESYIEKYILGELGFIASVDRHVEVRDLVFYFLGTDKSHDFSDVLYLFFSVCQSS